MKYRTNSFAPHIAALKRWLFHAYFGSRYKLCTRDIALRLGVCNGLSGSERVSHTGATGLRLQEAGSINRSLAALSDVIKVQYIGHQSDTET